MTGEYKQPDKCFICEKKLIDEKMDYRGIKGGEIELTFGYGSRFDQCNGEDGQNRVYVSAICDECFNKKRKLFTQYSVKTKKEWIKLNGKEGY